MALVTEDGTGLASAESYISVADADTYVLAFEPEGFATWNAGNTAQKEVALRKATQHLDMTYGARWLGSRINETMALDFPRSGICIDGASISSSAVPVTLERATAETAVRFMSADIILDVSTSAAGIRSERKKLDVLETEIVYVGSKSTQLQTPKLAYLIAPLITGSGRISLA